MAVLVAECVVLSRLSGQTDRSGNARAERARAAAPVN
jgi:hypothetical protein